MADEPGLHGLRPLSGRPHTRLLVTDDRAYDVPSELVADAQAGMITVCAAAARCAKLIDGHPAWRSGTATAMVCPDLHAVPSVSLPGELTLRPGASARRRRAQRSAAHPSHRGPGRADPGITDPDELADHLRAFAGRVRLFAAVDGAGVVRATSGSGTFGTTASVIFVNTDPDWRGRGIARAMTATAVRAAEQSGARHAGLDASDAGVPIYLRLGFQAATPLRRFRRAD